MVAMNYNIVEFIDDINISSITYVEKLQRSPYCTYQTTYTNRGCLLLDHTELAHLLAFLWKNKFDVSDDPNLTFLFSKNVNSKNQYNAYNSLYIWKIANTWIFNSFGQTTQVMQKMETFMRPQYSKQANVCSMARGR